MPSPTDTPTPPEVPAKDPIVDRVYDYTKWHIALYGAVLGVFGGSLALRVRLPGELLVSVVCLAVAGIAAGTLASSLSRRERWEGFLQARTFPLVPDSIHFGFTMQTWFHIQHAGIWAAILWGVGFAIVLSATDELPKKTTTEMVLPGTVVATPVPKP